MKRYEMIVIGAGPAGLSAAIEAAQSGLEVVVFDENEWPGGQLFKQIHKFFGSREHQARTRGVKIGQNLLEAARGIGVKVVLGATVLGIYKNKEIAVRLEGEVRNCKADAIVIATGASENMMTFDGWTLPGVMGAGAAQTLMNLHGVRPGKKILMVGSGNVGLVVSFQLKQAGCDVVAVVDAAARIGGYGVHAAKLARTGVPFYTSHTVVKAVGAEKVEGAVIAEVGADFTPIPGTEMPLDIDTVCIAVGLSPMSQLADNAGAELVYDPAKGGYVAALTDEGETSVKGLFCAGDVAGIEEASSAMIQGKIAAAAAARDLGYITAADFETKAFGYKESLAKIRAGMFAPGNKGRTDIVQTDEGYPLSESLLARGFLSDAEAAAFPAAGIGGGGGGPRPVIECTQNIPCDPCQDVCPKGCILVGDNITALPQIAGEKACSGCALCVGACSGQAIFLVNETYEDGYGTVGLPYEFVPLPQKGDKGRALGRDGGELCGAEVVEVRAGAAMDKTPMVVMKVPVSEIARARFFRPESEGGI
ncbi:MAG: FAD-dependent oxidoreductase [Clostridiales Family XIII bacterium]|jgi:NADPH-dependent 2,4-dienoyl-CoA reductase/sulfur reductase-like enzyme/Fe-S-cluster-containing hydrogenase component 2|nr:FAD-dependent oxidoreductase [Clostridiales Family XIII bacterium]